jgi:hypothetical protein|tara:strand:+ start:864 stop:1256 length:393 start_codon:yes stop_codon:yes gene_type:complete
MSLHSQINGPDLDGSYRDFAGGDWEQWTHIPAEDVGNTLDIDGIFSIIGVDTSTDSNIDSTIGELRIKAADFRSIATPRLLRKNDVFLSPADATNNERARYIVTEVPQDDGFGELVANLQRMTRTKVGDN